MKSRAIRICLLLVLCLCVEYTAGSVACLKAAETTKSTEAKNQKLKFTIVSATKKQIKIKFINESDTEQNYSQIFYLYQWKKGKWVEQKRYSPIPKCLYTVDAHSSRVEKIVFKKHFHKNMPKGKYKIKWSGRGSKVFKIK